MRTCKIVEIFNNKKSPLITHNKGSLILRSQYKDSKLSQFASIPIMEFSAKNSGKRQLINRELLKIGQRNNIIKFLGYPIGIGAAALTAIPTVGAGLSIALFLTTQVTLDILDYNINYDIVPSHITARLGDQIYRFDTIGHNVQHRFGKFYLTLNQQYILRDPHKGMAWEIHSRTLNNILID